MIMMVHQLQGRFIRLWNHCNSVAHPGLMSWLKYGGLVTLITQPILSSRLRLGGILHIQMPFSVYSVYKKKSSSHGETKWKLQ